MDRCVRRKRGAVGRCEQKSGFQPSCKDTEEDISPRIVALYEIDETCRIPFACAGFLTVLKSRRGGGEKFIKCTVAFRDQLCNNALIALEHKAFRQSINR